MGPESGGQTSGFLLFLGFEFFEERDEGVRIVTGLIHVLKTEIIGFRFEGTRELEEGHTQAGSDELTDAITEASANEDQRDGGDVGNVGAGLAAGGVTGGDVGDFVGHDAGQFRFFVGGQNQAGIYIEEPAGQREGVDLVGIDDLDGKGHFGVGIAHQVLPDAVYVFVDDRVLNQLYGLFNLHGILLAHANLFFDRIPVEPADLAVADGVDIFLAAIVLRLALFAGLLVLVVRGRGGLGARRLLRVRRRGGRRLGRSGVGDRSRCLLGGGRRLTGRRIGWFLVA